jgi:hypothetical protein
MSWQATLATVFVGNIYTVRPRPPCTKACSRKNALAILVFIRAGHPSEAEETPPEKLLSFLPLAIMPRGGFVPLQHVSWAGVACWEPSSPNISHVLLPPLPSLFTVPNTPDEPLNQRPKSLFTAIWSKVGLQHPPPSTLPLVGTFTAF